MDPPVTRVRILGKCTAELAAADQSADNQKLKSLTREVLRELRLDECLKGEATEFGLLALAVRKCIGLKVLSEVKRFNGSTKDLAKTEHLKRTRHAVRQHAPLLAIREQTEQQVEFKKANSCDLCSTRGMVR